MKGINLEISKERKAEMIDLIFGLMFDILWVSPYDRRRQEPSFIRFEGCARKVAAGICAINVADGASDKKDDIGCIVAELAECVQQLHKLGVISAAVYFRASEQVERLIWVLNPTLSGVETPSR